MNAVAPAKFSSGGENCLWTVVVTVRYYSLLVKSVLWTGNLCL